MKHYFKVILEETTEICVLFICYVFWHVNMQWIMQKGSGHHKLTSNTFYLGITSKLRGLDWFLLLFSRSSVELHRQFYHIADW